MITVKDVFQRGIIKADSSLKTKRMYKFILLSA